MATTQPQHWRFTIIAGAAGAIMLGAALLISETAPPPHATDDSELSLGDPQASPGFVDLPAELARVETRETIIARMALRDPKLLDASVQQFRRAAEHGDPIAATYLGYLYYTGKGVPQDDRFAVTWYTSAALAHVPEAQLRLALIYMQGRKLLSPSRSVDPDELEAIRWLRSAMEDGKTAVTTWPETRDPSDRTSALKVPPGSATEKLNVARGYLRGRVAQGDRGGAQLLCFSYIVHRDDPVERKRWCGLAEADDRASPLLPPLDKGGVDPFAILDREPFLTR